MYRSRVMVAGDDLAGRAFVGERCTLDGRPAEVIGRRLRFGLVAEYPRGRMVEFAWSTIARVMRAGGAFRS